MDTAKTSHRDTEPERSMAASVFDMVASVAFVASTDPEVVPIGDEEPWPSLSPQHVVEAGQQAPIPRDADGRAKVGRREEVRKAGAPRIHGEVAPPYHGSSVPLLSRAQGDAMGAQVIARGDQDAARRDPAPPGHP